jgi:hypothetical protein
LKNLGLGIIVSSENTAKFDSPTSIPIALSVSGIVSLYSASYAKITYHLSASFLTVQVFIFPSTFL